MEVLGLQPGTEPGIVNHGLVPPKARLQSALNLEMIQKQLDFRNLPGKIALDIGHAHVQSSHPDAFGLCFDNHRKLLSTTGEVGRENQVRGSRAPWKERSTVEGS
jgi:hypothetical protein